LSGREEHYGELEILLDEIIEEEIVFAENKALAAASAAEESSEKSSSCSLRSGEDREID
jgi:hypothetical protein